MSATPEAFEQEELEQFAAPLLHEAEKLRDELRELNQRRDFLLARQKRIQGAVDKLLPPAAKKATANGRSVSDERVEEVLQFVEDHPDDYDDGFVAGKLARDINLAGNPVGKDTVRKAVLTLHDRGLIRAERKTQGGGVLYKLIR